MLGQFTREEQTNCGLDLPGGDGATTVVVGQTASLGGDALEDVVHERVHDRHGLAGDTGVGVHLLQHFVDVKCRIFDDVGFLPPALLLLITLGDRLLGLPVLLARLSGGRKFLNSIGLFLLKLNNYKINKSVIIKDIVILIQYLNL